LLETCPSRPRFAHDNLCSEGRTLAERAFDQPTVLGGSDDHLRLAVVGSVDDVFGAKLRRAGNRKRADANHAEKDDLPFGNARQPDQHWVPGTRAEASQHACETSALL